MSIVSGIRSFVEDSVDWARDNPGKILAATTLALAIIRAHRAEPTPSCQNSYSLFKELPDDWDDCLFIGARLLKKR